MVDIKCSWGAESRMHVHTCGSQEEATMWLDRILNNATKGKFSLISELNEIQAECHDPHHTGQPADIFKDKFAFPLKIVNLVLQPYGFCMEESLS